MTDIEAAQISIRTWCTSHRQRSATWPTVASLRATPRYASACSLSLCTSHGMTGSRKSLCGPSILRPHCRFFLGGVIPSHTCCKAVSFMSFSWPVRYVINTSQASLGSMTSLTLFNLVCKVFSATLKLFSRTPPFSYPDFLQAV